MITTVVFGDGTQESTAQDFLFDKSREIWFEKTGPFDYHGPGVAPSGPVVGAGSVIPAEQFLKYSRGRCSEGSSLCQ